MAGGSILTTTKRVLGLAEDYVVFDEDVKMHINSTFSTLHQLGVGPDEGYMIDDENNDWDEFLDDNLTINSVKSYVWICVRLLFDPNSLQPATLTAFKEQKLEWEWRLQVAVDPPYGPIFEDDEDGDGIILDGGTP